MIYAEDLGNYWKTSQSSADSWIEKSIKIIEDRGGQVTQWYSGNDMTTGNAAFSFLFRFGDDSFKIIIPVLPSKTGNNKAARTQAATILYHMVKARVVEVMIFGARAAFISFLELEDGTTPAQLSSGDLRKALDSVYPRLPAQVEENNNVIDL